MRTNWLKPLALLGVLTLLSCEDTVLNIFPDSATSEDDQGAGKDLGKTDTTVVGCPGGKDSDGDGYGLGCPKGKDCDDTNKLVHPGAKELCDGVDNNCNNQTDEGVKNACGTCDPGCKRQGQSPFPVDKTKDTNVKDVNGVGLDPNGDLVLDKTNKNFNYMWISNTFDHTGTTGGCRYKHDALYTSGLGANCRGTLSKVNTLTMKEVARYFTVTCTKKTGTTGCTDLHGKPITLDLPHAPSRTAVDYNFDVWVANRAFGHQASATKVANSLNDCKDRNNNGFIDTSKDWNANGKIDIDCNADGKPDTASTKCTGAFAGKKPEFVGHDDECVLFTVNYSSGPSGLDTLGDVGRSICLDTGGTVGASNAWVGTFYRRTTVGTTTTYKNNFFRIDGTTGKLTGPYAMPEGHHSYGCAVDGKGILWSSDLYGNITYLNTFNPKLVGGLVKPAWSSTTTTLHFYGISVDGNNHVWLGGYTSGHVFRYKPDHSSWAKLPTGKWTQIKIPAKFYSRGIAADKRGKVWVAIQGGYILRLPLTLKDGIHDYSATTDYWPTKGTTLIGVGIDFAGHVWGISYNDGVASRLDVDSKGDVVLPATAVTKNVPVGKNPYTYSDFTGYGLQNFTRPSGRYLYQIKPCPVGKRATWKQLSWKATAPAKTSVIVRVRTGDQETAMGTWAGPYQTTPVVLKSTTTTSLVTPNPSVYLQVEFNLTTTDKAVSPTVHSYDVSYTCADKPQ